MLSLGSHPPNDTIMSVLLSNSPPDSPPRFSGVNPVRWILEIQEYFDYHLFSDADRLFFVRLFFEHPASVWLHEYRR